MLVDDVHSCPIIHLLLGKWSSNKQSIAGLDSGLAHMSLGSIAKSIAGPESKSGFDMDGETWIWASLERVTACLSRRKSSRRWKSSSLIHTQEKGEKRPSTLIISPSLIHVHNNKNKSHKLSSFIIIGFIQNCLQYIKEIKGYEMGRSATEWFS